MISSKEFGFSSLTKERGN